MSSDKLNKPNASHDYDTDSSYAVPIPQPSYLNPHEKFDVSLVNTDTDLEDIVARLKFVGVSEGLNFCFYGPSGTGKTEYARYVANEIGLPSIVIRSSDIQFSKYGMTERVLDRIFEEATKTQAAIIFDEADAFLYSRKATDKVYEASLINHFLTLFEEHTHPIICTTNNFEELDSAFLRRFMFKVKFKELKSEQLTKAFKHYFSIEMPDYIKNLPSLTLGDLGLVAKKAKVLGYLHDPKALSRMFYEDAIAKRDMLAALNTREKRLAERS